MASTKAFTTQLVALDLLALYLANARGSLGAVQMADHLKALTLLSGQVEQALGLEGKIGGEIARHYQSL